MSSDPKDSASLPAARGRFDAELGAIGGWLTQQGLLRPRFDRIVEAFCERLVAAGVPLWRAYASIETLHPTIDGVGCSWRPGEETRTELYIHRLAPSEDYLQSPFHSMLQAGQTTLRLRLESTAAAEFPLIERFRRQGATDYLARIVGFGLDGRPDGHTGVITSWATARPGGFDERDLEMLEHLLPPLALALQARLAHEMAINLLDTYVGREAGRRILAGEIRRGSLEVISAVILYADLRGFTRVADRCPREAMVEMLNAYFDSLVPVISRHGGQVLKFLGDGLLATFPLDGRPPAEACERALDAAAEALIDLRTLNQERSRAKRPFLDLDMVLHLGDVFYGNVGSADRLDFTVIGPAVNEASRIEALCSQHERNLLISETFARAAGGSRHRLLSIGRHALRGVRTAQTIYTLDAL